MAGSLVALALLIGLAAVDACTDASPAHPPVLSDCIPKPDAGTTCGTSSGGGGGSGPTSDGGLESAVDAAELGEGAACGTAGELLNATSTQCLTCVETACCLASAACTGPCLSLVQCPAGTINSCQSTFPAGVSAYDDFASCLAQSCPTQCPALPIATAGDF